MLLSKTNIKKFLCFVLLLSMIHTVDIIEELPTLHDTKSKRSCCIAFTATGSENRSEPWKFLENTTCPNDPQNDFRPFQKTTHILKKVGKKKGEFEENIENCVNEKAHDLRCQYGTLAVFGAWKKCCEMEKGFHSDRVMYQRKVLCKIIAQYRASYNSSLENPHHIYDEFRAFLRNVASAHLKETATKCQEMSNMEILGKYQDIHEEVIEGDGKNKSVGEKCVEMDNQNTGLDIKNSLSNLALHAYDDDDKYTNVAKEIEDSEQDEVIEVKSSSHNPVRGGFACQESPNCEALLGSDESNKNMQKKSLFPFNLDTEKKFFNRTEVHNICTLQMELKSYTLQNLNDIYNERNLGCGTFSPAHVCQPLIPIYCTVKDVKILEEATSFCKFVESTLPDELLSWFSSSSSECVDGNEDNENSNTGGQKKKAQTSTRNNIGNRQLFLHHTPGGTSSGAGGDDPEENHNFRCHNGHYDEIIDQNNVTDKAKSDNETGISTTENTVHGRQVEDQTFTVRDTQHRQVRIENPSLQSNIENGVPVLSPMMDYTQSSRMENKIRQTLNSKTDLNKLPKANVCLADRDRLLSIKNNEIEEMSQRQGHRTRSAEKGFKRSYPTSSFDVNTKQNPKRLKSCMQDVPTTSGLQAPSRSKPHLENEVVGQFPKLYPGEIPGRGPDGHNKIPDQNHTTDVPPVPNITVGPQRAENAPEDEDSSEDEMIQNEERNPPTEDANVKLGGTDGQEGPTTSASHLSAAGPTQRQVVPPASDPVRAWNDANQRQCSHCHYSASVFSGEVFVSPQGFVCENCLEELNVDQAVTQRQDQSRTFNHPPPRVTISVPFSKMARDWLPLD